MALVRWSPVGQLAGMEIDRLNRMFSELYEDSFRRGWTPAVDIYETEAREVVIKAELARDEAGRHQRHVREQRADAEGGAQARARREAGQLPAHRARHGTFSRSFTLPSTVDAGQISASYKDGVLTIRLPQREEAKAKQIAVNAD